MNAMRAPTLTEEEQAFIDGPVEEYCKILDSWKITESDEQDMPQEAWDHAKSISFSGWVFPKNMAGTVFPNWRIRQL